MGRVKEFLIDHEFHPLSEKYVCSDCVEDYGLKNFILENAESNKCSYCGKENSHSKIATDINKVIIFLIECIKSEWGDPNDEGVSWISRDGGWVSAPVIDTYDLLVDKLEIGFNNNELFQEMVDALFDREWCQKDPHGLLPQDELSFTWERFSDQVKHETRYVFFRALGKKSINEPQAFFKNYYDILDYIGTIVSELSLIRSIEKGAIYYRGRASSSMKKYHSVEDLGPPSEDKAIYSNRMSCAGIPLFYGALDRDTVIQEIYDPSKKPVLLSTVKFETMRDINILDLTKLPQIPSLFDEQWRGYRAVLIFLNAFLKDIAKPISKDGHEHIEYVPSQVLTEYFQHVHKFDDGEGLDGIYYPSSRCANGISCVLFFKDWNCIIDRADNKDFYEKTLSMVSTSLEHKKYI